MNSFKKMQFSIHRFGWVFTFKLVPSLVTILLLSLLLHLGFWQLERAAYKKQLEQSFQRQQQQTAINFTPSTHYAVYSRVTLQGHYDNKHSFLLDNSIYQHQVGYQVFTPFKIRGTAEWVLVNRGWIAGRPNHQFIPVIPPMSGELHLEGLTGIFPTKSFILGPNQTTHSWPRVIQSLKQQELEKTLHRSLNPSIILLLAKQPGAFETQMSPQLTISSQRHFGYAIQWFALALTLVIIWLIFSLRRDTHGSHQAN